MSDVLIRDVPDHVLAVIDANAARLGLSRNEYVRRELRQVAQRAASPVSAADLQRFSNTFRDLADADVMDQAWK